MRKIFDFSKRNMVGILKYIYNIIRIDSFSPVYTYDI